jgi:hypothetical protein
MLLFRSEEHLQRWRAERDLPYGVTFSLEQQWKLARIWYSDRADPDWRRRTPEEAEAVFQDVGLTGSFWKLT